MDLGFVPPSGSLNPAATVAQPHDYLSEACAHRHHGECGEVDQACRYCHVGCGCVCHRWAGPAVESA